MKDEYYMNIETGEIMPAMEAIADFYKSHGWREAWTDIWQPTGLEAENSYISLPDFTKVIKI